MLDIQRDFEERAKREEGIAENLNVFQAKLMALSVQDANGLRIVPSHHAHMMCYDQKGRLRWENIGLFQYFVGRGRGFQGDDGSVVIAPRADTYEGSFDTYFLLKSKLRRDPTLSDKFFAARTRGIK